MRWITWSFKRHLWRNDDNINVSPVLFQTVRESLRDKAQLRRRLQITQTVRTVSIETLFHVICHLLDFMLFADWSDKIDYVRTSKESNVPPKSWSVKRRLAIHPNCRHNMTKSVSEQLECLHSLNGNIGSRTGPQGSWFHPANSLPEFLDLWSIDWSYIQIVGSS